MSKTIGLKLTSGEEDMIDFLKKKYSIKSTTGIVRYALLALSGKEEMPTIKPRDIVDISNLRAVHTINRDITLADGNGMVTLSNPTEELLVACVRLAMPKEIT